MPLSKEETALRAWTGRLRRIFGITDDDYYAIIDWQGGQCPICGKEAPSDGTHWPVDHDHRSGEVRGVPCPYDNRRRIGQWKESDIPLLEALLDYLKNPPARRHFGGPRIVPGHGKRKRRKRAKPVTY